MKLTVTYKSGRIETYEAVSGRSGEPSVPYTLEFTYFPEGWPTERMTEDLHAEKARKVNISLFTIEDAEWDDAS